ncbi:unnamed protein product [Moneuplotes crassus]|uniref:Protein kinase domain-containing protein n=1 Tax=Euplotes crassus TaxID=5936 RepID=A0AAD1U3X4_EUPCR|nr:unnamed protein product [Moneuplotes crassus]
MPDISFRDKTERLVYNSSSSKEEEEDGNKENETDSPDNFVFKRDPPKKKKEKDRMVDIYNKSDLIDIEQKRMTSSGFSETIFSRKKSEKRENRRFRYHKEEVKGKIEDTVAIEVLNEENSELSFESWDVDDCYAHKEPKLEDLKIIKVLDKGSFDFIEGGNLYQNMYKVKRFKEHQVKFFAAQLVLAFAFLHDHGIVHRYLKPENVLLGAYGYLKLADFGIAKPLPKENLFTYSFCGTTEYSAQEIVRDEGHSFTVDLWTLGILVYELITGRTPFLHKNTHQTTKLIKKGRIIFPDPVKHKIDMSDNFKDFIVKLLHKKPSKRLGLKSSKAVINHPWFSDIDWDKLKNKRIKSPYMPGIKDKNLKSHILSGISSGLGFNKRRRDDQGDVSETSLAPSKLDLVRKNKHKFEDF